MLVEIAIAFWSQEIVKDLPKCLYDELENGTYGKDYLVDLDTKLNNY